jgi:hypothetical protein
MTLYSMIYAPVSGAFKFFQSFNHFSRGYSTSVQVLWNPTDSGFTKPDVQKKTKKYIYNLKAR